MNKTLFENLETRYNQVQNRLNALDLEKEMLIQEQEALKTLLPVYRKFIDNYDPIEEERRMTAMITNLTNMSKKRNGKKRPWGNACNKGKSRYDELFKIIFETTNKPLTAKEVLNKCHELDVSTTYSKVYAALQRAVKYNKLIQVNDTQYIGGTELNETTGLSN